MSHPHPVGVLVENQKIIESVDPKFVREGLLTARQKTLEVLEEVRGLIREGMTEDEARVLSLQVFSSKGVTRHWHKPYVRFGAGTALTFHDPLQTDYRLKSGDPYYLDFGPVWTDVDSGLAYEGDYGDTFVLGENPEAEKCLLSAHSLFEEARKLWKQERLSGEKIYEFLKCRSQELGYSLVEKVDGHRVGDFPHHKYSKERLAKVPFVPSDSLWVLEIQINDPQGRFGAFFEDLL